jgi:hypothetical protein
MAEIYNFQGFGAQFAPNFQPNYNNIHFYQNPQIYYPHPFPSCNYNFPISFENSSSLTFKDDKMIIDLENTEIHSKCDGSESSEKPQNNFTENILEIQEDLQSH